MHLCLKEATLKSCKSRYETLRFAISGDPVSMFDMNAQTTFKAPEFNVEGITNIVKTYNEPTLNNIKNVADKGMPDITLGLHSMSGSYSDPSNLWIFYNLLLKVLQLVKH